MPLENKNAVIYRAGGAIGGAVARAFAHEDPGVFLSGRNLTAVPRPHAIPETATIHEAFGLHAEATGMTREQFQARSEGMTHARRLPRLAEVPNVAAFIALIFGTSWDSRVCAKVIKVGMVGMARFASGWGGEVSS